MFASSRFCEKRWVPAVAPADHRLVPFEVAHLGDAFLLQNVPVASDSEKRRQVNPRKVYPANLALIPVFDRSGKARQMILTLESRLPIPEVPEPIHVMPACSWIIAKHCTP